MYVTVKSLHCIPEANIILYNSISTKNFNKKQPGKTWYFRKPCYFQISFLFTTARQIKSNYKHSIFFRKFIYKYSCCLLLTQWSKDLLPHLLFPLQFIQKQKENKKQKFKPHLWWNQDTCQPEAETSLSQEEECETRVPAGEGHQRQEGWHIPPSPGKAPGSSHTYKGMDEVSGHTQDGTQSPPGRYPRSCWRNKGEKLHAQQCQAQEVEVQCGTGDCEWGERLSVKESDASDTYHHMGGPWGHHASEESQKDKYHKIPLIGGEIHRNRK